MGLSDQLKNLLNLATAKPTKKAKDPMMDPLAYTKGSKTATVVPQQLLRFESEINSYKLAINQFEDVYTPLNEGLITLYADAMLDPHIKSCVEVRKNKTLSKDFKIVDESNEEIEELNEVIEAKWFRECLSACLDVPLFGYTLLQFGNLFEDSFERVKPYKREYVFAQKKIIRSSPSDNNGVPWESASYAPWYLGSGDPEELGLLATVIPSYIYKKNANGAWGNYQMLFGSPLRIGRTNMQDLNAKSNMEAALAEMGNSAYMLMSQDDEVEIIGGTNSDAYQVFSEGIDIQNKEISKAILGVTMLSEDGSSRSQSEVHERTSESIFKADAMNCEDWVNKCLIPHLERYFGFDFKGGKFVFDDTEFLSKQDQFEIDKELILHYNVDTEYITSKYGTPIEEKEEPEETNSDLNNKLPGGGGVGKSQPLNVLNSYTKIVSDFYRLCCIDEAEEDEMLPPLPGPVISESQEDEIYQGVYEGRYTPSVLPIELYFAIGASLDDGIRKGVTLYESYGLSYQPDQRFYDSLRENAFTFSGAKTFQQVREMSDLLVGEPSFREFRDKAKEVFDQYNGRQVGSWLRTEYDQAFNGAQMASKWEDFAEDADLFPFLQYDTIGDARVRPEHKILDGIIKHIDDPFWDTYFPPNGWRCRCDVDQVDEGEVTDLSDRDIPELLPEFEFNPGKSKMLYSPEHPYFIVEDQYVKLKDNNFNLPSAPNKSL